MKTIVLASHNPGKVQEIQALLAGFNITIIPQGELGITEIAEIGLSFVENALLKARHAAICSGLPALADDSGLEVDALGGAPGIYTSRYAGAGAGTAALQAKLLEVLHNVPTAKRTARGRCALVYLRHGRDPVPLICQGTWEGRIMQAPRGKQGFGFDAIFEVVEQGCSAAELAPAIKNQISHRGQALRQLIEALAAEVGK